MSILQGAHITHHFDLSGSLLMIFWRLPCRTLDSIGQACRQLRMVDVAMCPGISIASVRRFQARLPEVICIQSRFVGGADLTLTL